MCRTGTLRKLKVNLDKRIKIRNLDVLTPAGEKFRLRWKEYQILSLLVARSPELVTRTEIIENIWKGTYCSDSTINQTIKSIRQKISDTEHTLIRTIPRLGYKVENQAAFHFISEDEGYADDDILNGDENIGVDIQAELSENESESSETNDEKIDKPRKSTLVAAPVATVESAHEPTREKVDDGAALFQHARQPRSEIPDGIRFVADYFTFFICARQPNSSTGDQ